MKKHSVMNKTSDVILPKGIKLDYSLIVTDGKEYDLFSEKEVYSILVLQSEDGITTDYDFLYDIARDKENAVAILNMLVYNNVMPANARDVLADYL